MVDRTTEIFRSKPKIHDKITFPDSEGSSKLRPAEEIRSTSASYPTFPTKTTTILTPKLDSEYNFISKTTEIASTPESYPSYTTERTISTNYSALSDMDLYDRAIIQAPHIKKTCPEGSQLASHGKCVKIYN